jgi:pre-mRNA-splicing factor CWC22
VSRRVQYVIEKLFQVRKDKFKGFEGVIPELDLVEEADKITHNVSIDDPLQLEEACNVFKFDPEFESRENEWEEIQKEILGEYY